MLVSVKLLRNSIHPVTVSSARRAWQRYRIDNGWGPKADLLTPPDGNLKFAKSKERVVYGLSLAPANTSGHNVCPSSTPECRQACVAFGGNAIVWPKVTQGRILKTRFLLEDPSAFVTLLVHEIERARDRFGDLLVVRLNTYSDIAWELAYPQVFVDGVQYIDYTKQWDRVPHPNYHLTYSASERTTDVQIRQKLAEGRTVAVVFKTARTKPLPDTYLDYPVVDGDTNDLRHLDPPGVIVGLRAKGRMRKGDWKMAREPGPADHQPTRLIPVVPSH